MVAYSILEYTKIEKKSRGVEKITGIIGLYSEKIEN
jgi:hypothetical protein